MPDQMTFDFGARPSAKPAKPAKSAKPARPAKPVAVPPPPPPPPAPPPAEPPPAETPAAEPAAEPSPRKFLLQRAVLRWLVEERAPTAVALEVPTRVARFRADVAAFWSAPRRNPRDEGPRRLLVPTRTTIVECYTEREECWPDCVRTAEIMPLLQGCKARRADLESEVRQSEPELRDSSSLFEEYASWHFDRSRNPDYQTVLREIEVLERALVEGTRFEQVRSAEVADQLFLAVPAGLMRADEVANGWGLLWVHPDLHVTVEKDADRRACHEANRIHLVQNIAAAATRAVLMTGGVRRDRTSEKAFFVRTPRARRKPEHPALPTPAPTAAGGKP